MLGPRLSNAGRAWNQKMRIEAVLLGMLQLEKGVGEEEYTFPCLSIIENTTSYINAVPHVSPQRQRSTASTEHSVNGAADTDGDMSTASIAVSARLRRRRLKRPVVGLNAPSEGCCFRPPPKAH